MGHSTKRYWSAWALTLSIGSAVAAQAAPPAASKPATIQGVIVAADGATLKTKGAFYTEVEKVGAKAPTPLQASRASGLVRDTFSLQVDPGDVWLKYYIAGYAPAWVGPLRVTAGQSVRDVKLVLTPGKQALVQVVSTDGKQVARPTIYAYPYIGKSSNGPDSPVDGDEKGERVLEHLIDVPYVFRLKAPGYEPRTTETVQLNWDAATVLTMTPSLPATGTVLNADGTPVKGAKLRLRQEIKPENSVVISGYNYGEIVATTDEQGHFKLDQLIRGSQYVFVIESVDNARLATASIRAGLENQKFQFPKSQNLRVKLVGNFDLLPKSKEGRTIGIRQEAILPTDKQPLRSYLGADAVVTPTEDGGIVEFAGLVPGNLQIFVGQHATAVKVVENGLTEVTIPIRFSKQERPTIDLTLATVSGKIVLDDDSAPERQGTLRTDFIPIGAKKSPDRSQVKHVPCTDQFSVQVKPGTLWLTYHAEGYAPTFVGPMELAAAQKVDDVKIVIKKGRQSTLRLVSPDGKPVLNAKITESACHFARDMIHRRQPIKGNEKGQYALDRLADVPYAFTVTAPGYERLESEPVTFTPDAATELQMTRSLPATGIVIQHDGAPAKEVAIYEGVEKPLNRPGLRRGFAQMATTDAEGRFTLDQVNRNTDYLFVAVGPEDARLVLFPVRAGSDVGKVTLPRNQNLRVKLVGDLNILTASGRPQSVTIRNTFTYSLRGPQSFEMIKVAPIQPTDGGGVVEYKGLLPGVVKVVAGKQEATAVVVNNDVTQVTIELDKAKQD